MEKVACIYFTQANIILVKDNLIRTKIKNIYISEEQVLQTAYYNIYICLRQDKMTPNIWAKLENNLIRSDVRYIVCPEIEDEVVFEELKVINGNFMRRLLGYPVLKYITKYDLVKKETMYVRVGVVAGRFNDTLDVIIPLLQEITSLTIITEMPMMYSEVAREIYESHRIKVKVIPPGRKGMEALDVIYDVNQGHHYMHLCCPRSIYVDLLGTIDKRDITFQGVLPSIWQGFDILCDGYEVQTPLLEAMCYSEGFSKRNLRKKIKHLDISIKRVYTLGKLTMSV
ncbi:MAG: hypothetical protein ACRCTE_14505 [Cellulosilyticaceae bacterium]